MLRTSYIAWVTYYLFLYTAAKEAISFGPGHFNRVASEQYNNLGTEERARIVEVSVKKAGGKVFAKIQTQVSSCIL